MSKELERVTDLTGLLEEPRFLNAFCGGCRAAPKEYWDDCPALGDPEDKRCVRRRYFLSIKETLNGAQEDILIDMQDAGCVA